MVVWSCSLSKKLGLIGTTIGAILCAAAALPAQEPDEPARLLPPRVAFRQLENTSATFDYVLNFPPENPIVIEIHDSGGLLVAKLRAENRSEERRVGKEC